MKYAKSFLAVVLCLAVTVYGCTTGWISQALADLPVVLNIVTAILSLTDVEAVPQAQAAGAQAETDLQNLQKFLSDYQAAKDAATQRDALTNVQAALQAAEQDLSAILAAVHIQNPAKQAAIAAAVGVALSVVVSVESLLPGSAPKAAQAVKLPSPKDLRHRFNSAVSGAYPEATLK